MTDVVLKAAVSYKSSRQALQSEHKPRKGRTSSDCSVAAAALGFHAYTRLDRATCDSLQERPHGDSTHLSSLGSVTRKEHMAMRYMWSDTDLMQRRQEGQSHGCDEVMRP